MFAKNLHAVAFVAFDVSDVEHADVHADVSDIRGLLAVYERISSAIAEMTVQSVGIADGNGCNTRGTLHHRTAAISDARTCGNAANLQYGGTQGGDTRQPTVAERVDTVKPQSETTHIELAFGEPLYTCRIADVPEYAIWHGFLQHGRSFVETFELLLREVIKPFIVATHKMRENGTRPQCLLVLQTLDECRHIVFGVESQPAHTGIQLDVYRKFRNAFVACSVHKGIEESETVDFRFQPVLEEGVECRHFRIHDDDSHGDACLAEFGTFIGVCHCQIVHSEVLQRACHLDASAAIGPRLHHTGESCAGLHERTVVAHVLCQSAEIHFKHRFVDLQFQHLRNGVKAEVACTLQQHHIVVQRLQQAALQEFVRSGIEMLFHSGKDGV